MDQASGPPEVSQPSAVPPAARSDGSGSAADATRSSATAAGEARSHDLSEGSLGVTDSVERRSVSHGQETRTTESAASTVAATGSSPAPSMNGAGHGEHTASPSLHSDEKKLSEASPSAYREPGGVGALSPEKKSVIEDREERVGPEAELQRVSPSVADKDSAVPSPQKQQPEEETRGTEKPSKGAEEANGAKETPTHSEQKVDAMDKPGTKTTDAASPAPKETPSGEPSSEKKDTSEATKQSVGGEASKGNEAEEHTPAVTVEQPAKSDTSKSAAEGGTKLSEKPSSPSKDALSSQTVTDGAGDATQPTPDDTRPKSSIPPPPVYETPSRSSTGSADKREHREVEETKPHVNGLPEERGAALKKDGPREPTQEAEVTESIQAATACHTGIVETTLPGTIQKEVAPSEAYSSSGVLNDALDEEAIRAQLYPSMYEEAPRSSGAETKEPSTAQEREKGVADGLPSYTEALHDAKDQQLNITQKGASAGKEATVDDKSDYPTRLNVSEVSQQNLAATTSDDVKDKEHDKAAKDAFPTAEPATTTEYKKEAAQEERKSPAEVALSDENKMRADALEKKAEVTLPEKKTDDTSLPEASAKKDQAELKMRSDYTREKGMEEGKETERKTTEEFDASREASSDAVREYHEPSSKEKPAQVGDVTGDEDNAEKQPEHVQEDETVKDTSESLRDHDTDIGQQEVESATKESSPKEKEKTREEVSTEAPSVGELDVQELPPEQVEKALPVGNQASDEATSEQVSDSLPEDKDNEKKSESTDEAPLEPAGEVDLPGISESSGKEEAQGIAQVAESVAEKGEGELAVDETVQETEVPETQAVKEEAASRDEPTETEKEKDAGEEVAESEEKASEEKTPQVDTGQGAADVADAALSGVAGEETTPGKGEQEEAAAEAETEPLGLPEEGQPTAPEEASKEEPPEEKKTDEATDEAAPSELEATPTVEAVKKKSGLPKSPSKRAQGKGPPRSLDKKESPATPDAKSKAPSSPKKPSSIQDRGGPSPKKSAQPKNGATSPSKTARTPGSEQKKLPPIKAPVGQAPKPDLKNVRSKIGSLDNIKHKPKGGEVKVTTQKLEWRAAPKVGSLDNAAHKPGGGDKKIVSQKLDFKAQSKVGSLDNVDHKPTGGQVKVETQKLEFKDKATPKVGSLDNVKHKAGGGNVEILSEKLEFKERAASKIGSLPASDTGSTRGSESLSPTNMTSPQPPEQSQEGDVTAANGHDESDVSPTKEEALPAGGVPATAPPPEVAQC